MSDNMKTSLLILFSLLISSLTVYSTEQNLNSYEFNLPAVINNWSLSDKPDIFIGDDLFLFINGGAEIYHEYGFKKAISGVYKNRGSKSINIEIYEMTDPEAAFGIYSFKTSQEGKKIDLNGNQGKLSDYYLNFFSGKYMVTLIGFDKKKDTIDGIIEIARDLSKKLPQTDLSLSLILDKIKDIKKSPIQIKYFKGELVFFNIFKVAELDFLDIDEGIVGYYKKSKIFNFIYKSSEKQKIIYKKLFDYYRNKFPANFKKHMDGFSLIDLQKNEIVILPLELNIYLYIGKQSAIKPVFFNLK